MKTEKKTAAKIKEVEKIDNKVSALDKAEEKIESYSGHEQNLVILAGTKDKKCSFRLPNGASLKFGYDCCFMILNIIKEANDKALADALEKKAEDGKK